MPATVDDWPPTGGGDRITVDYVRRVDHVLDLVLVPAEAADDRPLESPRVRL